MGRYYLSTIDPNASFLAEKYDLGLEIAEYCTAWNMDTDFSKTDEQVRRKIRHCTDLVLHAPFNELFPCAIDPKARELAAFRYRQAAELAEGYGATKLVIHGGYHNRMYYPQWYVEQSISFWKEFLQKDPRVQIVLENVLEEQPRWLVQIVEGVNDPRFRLCMDIGHVNVYAGTTVMEWLEVCKPYLSHFHIHNNDGTWDTHSSLDKGNIPMEEFLQAAQRCCPDATFTLELTESEPSLNWLKEKDLWN